MRKLMAPAAYLVAFLLFASIIVWMLRTESEQETAPDVSIAVVLYGDETGARWTSLEQGISQACSELGIEKPVLTYAAGNDTDWQQQLVQREVNRGVGGLLVAAGSGAGMEAMLTEVAQGVPVVTVDSPIGGLAFVGVADEQLGAALADEVAGQVGAGGTVGVLMHNLEREGNALRAAAFMQRLRALGHTPLVLEEEPGTPYDQLIAGWVATNRPDALVALDNDTLELAADALPAAMVEVWLCGVGASDKVVHAMDEGVVHRICFYNEYAIGYQATMQLAARMGVATGVQQAQVGFEMIDRTQLYDPAVERLLFPITQ